jgi:hypothetical protein
MPLVIQNAKLNDTDLNRQWENLRIRIQHPYKFKRRANLLAKEGKQTTVQHTNLTVTKNYDKAPLKRIHKTVQMGLLYGL